MTLDFAVVTLNFKILQFLHVIKILFLAISQKVKVVGSCYLVGALLSYHMIFVLCTMK